MAGDTRRRLAFQPPSMARAKALLVAGVLLLEIGCGGPGPTMGSGTPGAAESQPPTASAIASAPIPPRGLDGMPPFSHVYLVILENRSFSAIVGTRTRRISTR